jgi:hypothetical protein
MFIYSFSRRRNGDAVICPKPMFIYSFSRRRNGDAVICPKPMFVYSFSRRRHGDVTSACFIDKNGGGLSLKTSFRHQKDPPNPQNSLLAEMTFSSSKQSGYPSKRSEDPRSAAQIPECRYPEPS